MCGNFSVKLPTFAQYEFTQSGASVSMTRAIICADAYH